MFALILSFFIIVAIYALFSFVIIRTGQRATANLKNEARESTASPAEKGSLQATAIGVGFILCCFILPPEMTVIYVFTIVPVWALWHAAETNRNKKQLLEILRVLLFTFYCMYISEKLLKSTIDETRIAGVIMGVAAWASWTFGWPRIIRAASSEKE